MKDRFLFSLSRTSGFRRTLVDFCVLLRLSLARIFEFIQRGESETRRDKRLLNHCPDLEKLAAYVDGNLTREEQTLVEAHLIDCYRCREIVSLTVKSESAVRIDP